MKRARRTPASPQNLSGRHDILDDRYLSDVAGHRLRAIRDGGDELLEEEDFWAKADRIMSGTK